MNNQAGGSAYPHENHLSHRGMSLRDYFAAEAMKPLMQTFLSANADLQDPFGWMDGLAMDAYSMADAMLKARNG